MRSRTEVSSTLVLSVVSGALVVLVALRVLSEQARGLTFFFDEWDFLTRRTISVDGLLSPHNGHLSTLPVVVYVTLRTVIGVDSYVPYQILGFFAHLATCFVSARMIHRRSPILGLGVLPVVLLLGAGWQNIMWPFQIGMIGALLFGLLAIDEASRDTPRNRVVGWVGLALLCAGGGVAVAGVVLLSSITRKQWRVLRNLAPVLILYALWYLLYGVSQSEPGNLSRTPRYVLDSAVWSAAGIGSWSFDAGRAVLALVLIVLAVTAAIRRYDQSTRAAVLLLGMLLATWVLTGFSRAHLAEPQASRYVYVGAAVLACCAGLTMSTFRTWVTVPILLGVLPLTIPSSIAQLEKGAGGLRDTSFHVRSALAALDMTEARPAADAVVDPRAPQLTIFNYDMLAQSHGRIGLSASELAKLPGVYRITADNMFNRVGATSVIPTGGSSCAGRPVPISGSRTLSSQETLIVFSPSEFQIFPRRFSGSTDAIDPLVIKGGEWQSLQNLAEANIPGVRFDLPLTGVIGCIRTERISD